LAENFFAACQDKIPQSKRYLYKKLQREGHEYNKTWLLYAPADLLAIVRKGIIHNV
jgi:hypothetical protein